MRHDYVCRPAECPLVTLSLHALGVSAWTCNWSDRGEFPKAFSDIGYTDAPPPEADYTEAPPEGDYADAPPSDGDYADGPPRKGY